MAKELSISESAEKHRTIETVYRVIGSGALAVGLVFAAGLAGQEAHGDNVQVPAVAGDVALLYVGSMGLSASASRGRQADLLEATLLNQSQNPIPASPINE